MTKTRSKNRRALDALTELHRSLGTRGPASAKRAEELLGVLATARFVRARDFVRLQRVVCFISAFPENARVLRAARALAETFVAHMQRLSRNERESLDDSGMAGTVTRHIYPASAARWLAGHFAAHVELDWPALTDASIAALLVPVMHPLERDALELTARTARAWLERARGKQQGTALAWLLEQRPPSGAAGARFERAFDTAKVQLAWHLADGRGGITRNALRTRVSLRADKMRRPAANSRAAIRQTLDAVTLLPRRAAIKVLDVWRAALWSRTRTTLHIERPNLEECYLGDFASGLQMAAIGIEPAARGVLEPSFGYLLLANGVPIGYGGFTPLFAQVNTGINVFPEFRGSEAAFAFEQALRLMRTLTGCVRFLVNPYQFGAGNDEALQSGAYWFYYRLGFRSAESAVRTLAEREFARLRNDRRYRVPVATLRKLATCDLHLDLRDDAAARYFEERWLPALVNGITDAIAEVGESDRAAARRVLATQVARRLQVDRTQWTKHEREGFDLFAPLLAQIDDLYAWPDRDKETLVQLCRARLAPHERAYVALLREHDHLRAAFARIGQRRTARA